MPYFYYFCKRWDVTLQKARETVPGNEIRIIGNLKHYAHVLAKTYAARRNMLRTKIGSGIVLFPGNPLSPNNYLNNAYISRRIPRSSIISDSTPRHWSA